MYKSEVAMKWTIGRAREPAPARSVAEAFEELRARGKQRTQADMLVAATAAVHDLALVTRNTRDFTDCGLALQNPFAHDRRRRGDPPAG
jgi:predicted nuclease of predicted toxin-antitoxin system